jgi:hypothetical protein
MALVAALSATSCKLKLANTGLSFEIEKGKTNVAQLETSIARGNEQAAAQATIFIQQSRAAEQATIFIQQARAAEQKRSEHEKALLADATGARSELERLRVAVSQASSTYSLPRLASAPGTSLDVADPFPDLLLDCSKRYIDMAGKADGHANDAKALTDAWPRN